MTDDQLNDMWYCAVGSGDPTAGNAHLRFARAVQIPAAAQPIDGFGGNLDSAFDAPAVPADAFEVRADGEKVRKDRWEWGIRRIVALLWGNRQAFEVDDVVDAVRGLVPTPNDDAESLCATVQNNYVAPDVPTPDYIATIEVLRARIAALESAAPAVPAAQIGMKASTWAALSPDAQNLILEAGQRAVDKTKAQRLADAAARATMVPIPLDGSAAPAVREATDKESLMVREPLTDGQVIDIRRHCASRGGYPWEDSITFARAIERAHGITGDSNADRSGTV